MSSQPTDTTAEPESEDAAAAASEPLVQAPAPPPDGTALSWVHASRLRAAEREMIALLSQVTGLARYGRNPLGQGPNYAPMTAEDWAPLSHLLDELASSARRVGTMAGPVGAVSAVHGPTATRNAIVQRLEQMEEVLRELDPARVEGKYGPLPPRLSGELAEQCTWMRDLLAQARATLGGE